jgi:HAE1 family hydrophobic/amphiphilic exporter-1
VWLTRFCIKNPIVVSMFFIGLAVFGVLSYRALGAALNPNVTFPIVEVTANYAGASPSEMERLIVKPIEDQLDGIDNLDQMSATAQEGTAVVVVQFKLDTNIDYAAIDVQRRVDTARVYMPTDLDPPTVDKSAGSQVEPILTLAVSSKSLTAPALSDLISDHLASDLKHIPDVQSVDVSGDVKREFEVEPDRARLLGTNATLADIFNAVSNNNANLPGGLMTSPTAETTVSVHGEINQPSDILAIPLGIPSLSAGGISMVNDLHIGDVANAYDGHVDQRVVSHYNGLPTIHVQINRLITADEIKSTAVARKGVAEIAKRYPQLTIKELQAPADYTQAALDGVLQSLFEGIVLTALVLLLFLHAWRNAVVVMVAIPSSLLATFIMMRVFGFTLDIVSLMGLSLTIGILVDDSIVVLENITRHRDAGESPADAAVNGRSEIGSAAVAITLVDVVVFLPIAFLSGIVGKFMKEFGIVVVVATLFSLLVSFTLTPMLAALWSVKRRSPQPPALIAWFPAGFERLLRYYHRTALPFALSHRWLTVGGCLALVLGAIALIPLHAIATDFVPPSQTGLIEMTVTYPVGTPLAKTQVAVDRLEEAIAKVPDVDTVLSTTGLKPQGWGTTTGGHVALLRVMTAKNRRGQTNQIVSRVRTMGNLVPGAELTVQAVGGGGAGGDPLYFTVAGPDDEIGPAGEKLAQFIRTIPGTVNVQTSAETNGPRLDVRIDPYRAALLGVSPGTAATDARIAVGGAVATKVRTAGGLVDVRVRFPEDYRATLDDLKRIHVRSQDGLSIYHLSDVADFVQTKAPTKIERLDKQRVVLVTGGVDPDQTTLGDVIGKIDAATKRPGFFPPGVSLRASGNSQFFQETFDSMSMALVTSFSLVYMLMVILYSSFLTPFVIMFSVPVAIVGALAGLALSHQSLNLFSMIGIVMLFGLVAKNGILLVDYAKTLRKRGMRAYDAMVQAAETRFRPILMTTASMVFGMLPLALGLAEGAEFRRSMGTVLIGGLLSSLILTLFLVPVIDVWIVGGIERRADRKAALREHAADPQEPRIGAGV